jgi:hypothetical protein
MGVQMVENIFFFNLFFFFKNIFEIGVKLGYEKIVQ